MIDFSMPAILLAFLKGLWITLSPAALAGFLAGVAILAVVACGLVVLPVRYRLPAILAGAVLLVLGVGWQLALAEGAKTAILADSRAAIAAEAARADRAEKIGAGTAASSSRKSMGRCRSSGW